MARDWKCIAQGLKLPIPEKELDELIPFLEGIEQQLQRAQAQLPLTLEPATQFQCHPHRRPDPIKKD